ncbi:MAG: transglutaminase domain-containing protein [Deltaproteobacteria bacterium]|nr:transglutaminase domain-containing protein [Deltaproteobacteria bacterium]
MTRAGHLAEALPLLAALLVNAIAHDRWLVAAAGFVVVTVAVAVGARPVHRGGVLLLLGIGGAAGGLALSLVSDPPPGPLPPVVQSALGASLAAMSAYCVVTRNAIYASVYAWLLVAISLNAEATFPLQATTALACGVTLLSAFLQSRAWRTGAGWAGFVVVAGLSVVGGAAVATGAQQLEGTLNRTLYSLLRGLDPLRGLGTQREVTLSVTSSLVPTDRPLAELSGNPGRLRTQVMDTFDGSTWKTSAALRAPRPAPVPTGDATTTVDLLTLEDLADILPAPAGTFAVRGGAPGWEGAGILRDTLPAGRTLVLRHTVDPGTREVVPPAPRDTALPEDLRDSLAAIARPLVGEAATADTAARVLESFFQENFEYSLEVDLRGRGHPLLTFIRERRPAYCVYFASAMAALLRSVDIPARLVGGFVPEEFNTVTGRALIRERDAHAWVEVYVAAQQRWVPYDPTPWRGRNAVLGLDRRPAWLADLGTAVRSVARRAWYRVRNDPLGALQDVVLSPVGALAGMAAAAWWWRRRRGTAQRVALLGALAAPAELRALHARFTRAVVRLAGTRPHSAETDDEFLLRVGDRLHTGAAGDAHRFLHAWQRLRFAGDPTARAEADGALASLEADVPR